MLLGESVLGEHGLGEDPLSLFTGMTDVVVDVTAAIGATASLGAVTYSIIANPQTITATAQLDAPEVAIIFFPSGIAAEAALGEPTWAAVAEPYPILSWARLDPILALGYAAAVDATVVIFNANTLAATEYSIDALDVMSHDGELYFVLADGLSKLVDSGTVDADTDFTAAVQTGALYLAGNKIGVVPRAYVGAKTSAALQLTVSTYSYGATLANDYTAPVPVASASRAQVVPLGKGAEAEAWQFKIDSIAPGADWGLASLEAVVSPIKRPRL